MKELTNGERLACVLLMVFSGFVTVLVILSMR